MAVSPAMFLFEVVVESVKSLVESRRFIIKSDFGDIFSLELKDPKQMHIVMPEPPPLPPEPPGKKGKKPKAAKGKKGKKGKGKVEEPPPEPVIQAGQSVLFSSTAEFLIQTMKKFPLELSLWSDETNYCHIGSTTIPWDLIFLKFLEKVYNCESPLPVKVNDEYNVFQEGTAKLMAKLGIEIKLTYLSEKITTAFRTLSEDPTVQKILYTGMNSKTTSYICTLKTTDKDFEQNCNKIDFNFVKDKPKPNKIAYANYKNAPGANLTDFKEGDYCCMNKADKPPLAIHKAPETSPSIDFIIDYVRKIIISCNDNMRMLTPRPVISPRIKATDIDRLCYCKETNWPDGKTAERFKNEVQSSPCAVCINAGDNTKAAQNTLFDMANLRGPCGKPDCNIARYMRAYIEDLVEEDNKEININDIVGPCGSLECTLAEKIKQILRHEGAFTQGSTLKGLSTQCACLKTLEQEIENIDSCVSSCTKNCEDSDSKVSNCEGPACPFKNNDSIKNNVYNVYYFTVEHDFNKDSSRSSSPPNTDKSSKFKSCLTSRDSSKSFCSKSCTTFTDKSQEKSRDSLKCEAPICQNQDNSEVSPADSDIIINFDEIQHPCQVKTCDFEVKIKDLIVDGVTNKKNKISEDDPCYCDCVCDFKFSRRTTYCAVCGGYECLGDDVRDMPEFRKPHPCPVYHKTYNKNYIKVQSPWSNENLKSSETEAETKKNARHGAHSVLEKKNNLDRMSTKILMDKSSEKKIDLEHNKSKKISNRRKTIGKFTANNDSPPLATTAETKPKKHNPRPLVPKNKGWSWDSESIPGMKTRPQWRPGAVRIPLLRRYRAVREGVDIIARKKRAMMQKKKKLDMKPTLVVTKQNGEYKVQMEVFKTYSKERLPFQYPYDEKPPLVYTIGKTEEERRKLQRQRERRERRETRRKSRLIQSTFRDRCQEICLKAYNQAIGLLPLPNPNSPECPCETVALKNHVPSVDSCSCSDEEPISSSDTDGDEWVVEFTPPIARWNIKAKHQPTLADGESQYSYLDYKVKLLDKSNNPVVRFFKGPDGKQECSDLGGFWGPGHVWLEINKDGYIGPDNRWVPNNFYGPDGNFYAAEEGEFTDIAGNTFKIGIDGYIDIDNKWAWYTKRRSTRSIPSKSTFYASEKEKKKYVKTNDKSAKGQQEVKNTPVKSAKATGDKKQKETLTTNKDKVKVNKTVSYSSGKGKSPVVMCTSVIIDKQKSPVFNYTPAAPTSKTINKYREIMQELEMYDDICEYKPLITINRASNTPRKRC